MKKWIVALMAVTMMTVCVFAQAETLKVGMECNYAPYNWTQSNESEDAVAIAAAMPTDTTCALPSASRRNWAWSLKSSRPSGTAWFRAF